MKFEKLEFEKLEVELLFFDCFDIFGFSKTCLLLCLIQSKGLDGLDRVEETKLVCAISRKCVVS